MGNDRNEPTRKPRTRNVPQTSAPNPFASKRASGMWADLADVPQLAGILTLACEGGRAILLGHTRDGGAWVVQVLDGEQRFKSYASTREELIQLFADLQEAYQAD